MPSFVCDNCQTTLKKNQLDSHKQRSSCFNHSVSCIDCGKTFRDVEYRSHISCLTEAEKYKHNPTGKSTAQKNKNENNLKMSKNSAEKKAKKEAEHSSKQNQQTTSKQSGKLKKSTTLYNLYKKSSLSKKEFLKQYLIQDAGDTKYPDNSMIIYPIEDCKQ